MSNWKEIVGKSFTPQEFDTYCHSLHFTGWRPSFIVLHNTSTPNLAQRPDGFTHQHILNLEDYYKNQQRWSAGPHLFIDDHQIWVFTPLTTSGIHSPSWNKVSLGFEMLGDYEKDAFDTGRGLAVQKNAVAAIAIVSSALGLDPDSLKFHKEDDKTTHKDCPGEHVVKSTIIEEVKTLLAHQNGGEHTFLIK